MTGGALTNEALDRIFRTAHTPGGWLDKAVPDSLLQSIYDLMKFGPTSANGCPLRMVFIRTPEGKARLKPFLLPGNVDKVMAAPVTVIFAHDMKFYEHLPRLFPHADARAWFEGNDAAIAETAFRNGSLQAAYFIIAARALGVDCGAMSGFDAEGVNKAFFADGRFKANFICNLGYADPAKAYPRSPRLAFDEACSFA